MRNEIIRALKEQMNVDTAWCEQFQTEDLKDMLDTYLGVQNEK